jgi:protein TonB
VLDWYARRDDVSRLAAVLVVGVLLSPLLKYRPTVKAKPSDSPIQVQLSMLTEEPEPAVAPLVAPPPRTALAPVRQPNPVAPIATEPPVQNAAPATPQPPLAAPVATAPPVPSPPLAAPPISHSAGVEDSYVASVRAYMNVIKRYPTGREASIQRPRGKARVWFVLGRDGRLVDAGIDESSDSLLLDRTALATVQRGGFPAFPETAWSGQNSRRFTVELEFVPTS